MEGEGGVLSCLSPRLGDLPVGQPGKNANLVAVLEL